MAKVILTLEQLDLIDSGNKLSKDTDAYYFLPFVWKIDNEGRIEQIFIGDIEPFVFDKLVIVDKEYEIWRTGYAVTGNQEQASLVTDGEDGRPRYIKAASFNRAVETYIKMYPACGIEKSEHNGKIIWSDWGCILYDNEQDARKQFG